MYNLCETSNTLQHPDKHPNKMGIILNLVSRTPLYYLSVVISIYVSLCIP